MKANHEVQKVVSKAAPLFNVAAASVAIALGVSSAQAQQITATAGQELTISDQTTPSPIVAISASGAGASITGTDAVIRRDHKSGAAVSASSGGFIDLTGGSIENLYIGTGTLNSTGVSAGANGTVHLSDLSVAVSASGGDANAPYGLNVTGNGSITASNVDISASGSPTTTSEAGAAVRVKDTAGSLTLSNGSTVSASGAFIYGLFATNGGQITSLGTDLTTTGADSIAVYSNASNSGGSLLTLTGGSVTTTGARAHGLYGARQSKTTADTRASIVATDLEIETSGANAYAVFADRGSDFSLIGGSVKSNAANTAAMLVQSANGSVLGDSNLSTSNTAVTATGHAATGVTATAGGVADLTGGSVTTEGYEGYALYADDTNSPDGTRSTINAHDVTINTALRAAHGAYAVSGGLINLEGGSIHVLAGTSSTYAPGYTYGLYAKDEGSRITGENVDITTHEAWSYGVHVSHGGEIQLTGGTVQTSGERGFGLSASGHGGTITSTADIRTSGTRGHGVQAYNDGTDAVDEFNIINLTGGSISTTGSDANGIQAVRGNSTINSGINITASGSNSNGAVADRGGVINIGGGLIQSLSENGAGLAIFNGGSITVENATVQAQGVAARVNFDDNVEDRTASIEFGAGSDISSAGDVLLEVNRAETAGGPTGNVTLTLLSGAVAKGNILDTGTKTTGFLDINVNQGAQLTSDSIEGFRNLQVNGNLLGHGTLTIFENSALTGIGSVNHNVTMEGGTLDNTLIIKGTLTLGAADQVVVDDEIVTTDQTAEAGKQLVITGTVGAGTVDVTEGTATIGSMNSGSTLKAGNWGATVTNLNGATIEAGNGSVNVTNVTGGTVTSGALIVNNDGGSGEVGELSVGENASLAGNGTVQADTTLYGSLNPGNSPGTLGFAGDLTLTDSSTTTLEINGFEEGEFDTVEMTGGVLTLDGTLTLNITSALQGEATLTMFDLSGGGELLDGSNFDLVQLAGVYGSSNFVDLGDGNWNLELGYNSFSFDATTGTVQLNVVPEPGTWALLAATAAAALIMRRRKIGDFLANR